MSLAKSEEWDMFLQEAEQVKDDPESLQEVYFILHWMSKRVSCDVMETFLDFAANGLRKSSLADQLHKAIEAGASAQSLRKLVAIFPDGIGSYDAEYQTPLDILCCKFIMNEERQKYSMAHPNSKGAESSSNKMLALESNLWECARIMLVALSSAGAPTIKLTVDEPPLLHALVLAGSKCPESLRSQALSILELQLTLPNENGDLPIHAVCCAKLVHTSSDKEHLESDEDGYLN
jgi:hypothetical protein